MLRRGSLKGAFASLLGALARIARVRGVLSATSCAAVDATGLESRHVSRYYRWRLGGRHAWHEWPKLTVVCDVASHFWLGAYVSMGPSQDSPQFEPAVRQAAENHPLKEVLRDKGYDSERNKNG